MSFVEIFILKRVEWSIIRNYRFIKNLGQNLTLLKQVLSPNLGPKKLGTKSVKGKKLAVSGEFVPPKEVIKLIRIYADQRTT